MSIERIAFTAIKQQDDSRSFSRWSKNCILLALIFFSTEFRLTENSKIDNIDRVSDERVCNCVPSILIIFSGLIEFLVRECGANINAKTFSDQTPLSLANEDNREHLCILLTTLGAKQDQ